MSLGNAGVIVSARTASRRLPGKALLPLGGLPMVLYLLRRLRATRGARVVLATTTLESDDDLSEKVFRFGIPVFRGAADDLILRYRDAANYFGFDTVVRITADCPFVDAALIEYCLQRAEELANWDLVTTKGRFPVGLDAEILPTEVLRRLAESDNLSSDDREHLTLHLYNNDFRVRRIPLPDTWPPSKGVYTVDTPEDYRLAQEIVEFFKSADFSVEELLSR